MRPGDGRAKRRAIERAVCTTVEERLLAKAL
jgi:hypothetical protein